MAIEVHCPNPACAKIHQVKDRYSGMRGRCPACKAWMYIPAVNGALSSSEPYAVVSVGEEPIVAAAPRRATAVVEDEEPPFDRPIPSRSRAKKEEPEEADEVSSEPVAQCRFSWMGAILLLLGALGLGAIATSPYLDAGTAEGIDAEFGVYTSIVPGAVAGLVFLLLLVGLMRRRQGFLTLSFLYLVTAFSSAGLFLALLRYKDDLAAMESNQQLCAAIGGAVAACVSFFFASLFIHRRWLSRIITFLILGIIVAVAPLLSYRVDLGIDDMVPEVTMPDVKGLFERIGL